MITPPKFYVEEVCRNKSYKDLIKLREGIFTEIYKEEKSLRVFDEDFDKLQTDLLVSTAYQTPAYKYMWNNRVLIALTELMMKKFDDEILVNREEDKINEK